MTNIRNTNLLDDEVLKHIEKTLPIMRKNAKQIAVQLYKNIFRLAPSVKSLFSLEFLNAPGTCPLRHVDVQLSAQAQLLSDSFVQFAFAAVKGNLATFDPAMSRICAKHVSRGVQKGHFPVVLDAFSEAIKDCIGHLLSEDDLKSWKIAVQSLADELIKRELALAEHLKKLPNSWDGFRKFVAARKCHANGSRGMSMATLTPVDSRPVAEYTSGQYVCVRMVTEDHGLVHFNAPLQTLLNKPPRSTSPNNPTQHYFQHSMNSNSSPSGLHQIQNLQVQKAYSPLVNANSNKCTIETISKGYEILLPVKNKTTTKAEKESNGEIVSTVPLIYHFVNDGMVVEISPPVGGFILQKARPNHLKSPLAVHRLNRPVEIEGNVGHFAGQRSLLSLVNNNGPRVSPPVKIRDAGKHLSSNEGRSPLQDIINRRGIQYEGKGPIGYLG